MPPVLDESLVLNWGPPKWVSPWLQPKKRGILQKRRLAMPRVLPWPIYMLTFTGPKRRKREYLYQQGAGASNYPWEFPTVWGPGTVEHMAGVTCLRLFMPSPGACFRLEILNSERQVAYTNACPYSYPSERPHGRGSKNRNSKMSCPGKWKHRPKSA